MKKRKMIGIFSCILSILCSTGFVTQAATSATVTNTIETGVIDITLTEYQKTEDGKEELWQNNPTILPGMYISKIPRITNEGNDCYVRAKIESTNPIIDNLYDGFGEGWFLAEDGYYYYDKILKTNEKTDIFQGIRIPSDFPQELEGQQIQVNISTDAIQSKNIKPDWEKKYPWGLTSIEIERCKETGPYPNNVTSSNKLFSVEYEGSAKELFAKPDDFFQNFPVLMPGDVHKDEAVIRNNSNNTVTMYFEQKVNPESKLFGEMDIILMMDGETFFSGKMNEVIEKKVLCKLKPKEKKVFTYQISIPKELNNDYTLEKDGLKWIFTCNEKIKTVQTGDMGQRGLLLGGLIFGALGIALINDKKRSKC